MPNKSIPTIGLQDWGTPLNAHLAQLQNPTNGGINTFEQFSSRPTTLTADDVGKTYLYTQTGNLHQWTGTMWKVLNESVINVKDYGAIGDGVADDTAAIQSAIDLSSDVVTQTKAVVYVPQGRYRITTTLNCTSTPILTRMELHIKFENRSSDYKKGTLLLGETGNNPVIDTTGSSAVVIENCGIISGVNNPSKIGILQARPDGGTGWCGRHKYTNLFIDIGSDLAANGKIGTIGFINIAGEESEYNNIEIWANTCYVNNKSKNIRTSNLNGTFNNFTVTSPFGIPITPSGSNTTYTFSGMCRMISFEYFTPAVLIDDSTGFNLGDTFIQKRFAPRATATTEIIRLELSVGIVLILHIWE
jgi:Pectate lyase superfamily protein